MLADADDGLALDTVHVYVPETVTVRVWVYCAVTGLFNTVSVPWMTVVESLVQVTVVAGPPVEIQVRVSWSESNATPPDIEMFLPIFRRKTYNCLVVIGKIYIATTTNSKKMHEGF